VFSVAVQHRVVSSLKWLQESSTVVGITWSRTSTTLLLLVSDSKKTGLEHVYIHECRVLLLQLSDSGRYRMVSEGGGVEDAGDAGGVRKDIPHVRLHQNAVEEFSKHACCLSRLSTPLDPVALRTCIAEGASPALLSVTVVPVRMHACKGPIAVRPV
jgi:hypothetical protein